MIRLKLTVSFLAIYLSSCTHYYYVANVQNVPLFREKNEFRLSGSSGEGDESNSIEVQSAYSVTDKIGIMTNFMSATGGNVSDNSDYAKGHYIDGAIGYYKTLDRHGVFEIYGGVGGSSQYQHYSNHSTSDISFTKLFIQPSYGITFNAFDIVFSTRICRLSYNNINNTSSLYNPNAMNGNLYNELNTIVNKKYLFLEPAITLRAGWKNVKLQLQAEFANVSDRKDLNFVEKNHISIGIVFAIAERYR